MTRKLLSILIVLLLLSGGVFLDAKAEEESESARWMSEAVEWIAAGQPDALRTALAKNLQWQDLPTGITIEYTIFTAPNPLDLKRAAVVSEATAVLKDESVFMVIRHGYEEPPVYEPKNDFNAVNYDAAGNRIVLRPKETFLWISPVRNDALQVFEGLSVNSNNEMQDTFDYYLFERFPVGDPFEHRYFRDFWAASGRGVGRIEQVENITVDPSGLVRLAASVRVGTATFEPWIMMLDPEADFLVRKAIKSDQTGLPKVEISTSGLVSLEGFSIAESGEIIQRLGGGLELQENILVHMLSDHHRGESCIEAIQARFSSPLPENAEMFDYRTEGPLARRKPANLDE